MNGSLTSIAIPQHYKPVSADVPIPEKVLTGQWFGNQTEYLKRTGELTEMKEQQKEEAICEKIVVMAKPIPYIISFSIFLTLSALSVAFMLVSALKNITIINPAYLLYGFLGSVGLAITSWKGILTWKE